jgi:hypothetical protein
MCQGARHVMLLAEEVATRIPAALVCSGMNGPDLVGTARGTYSMRSSGASASRGTNGAAVAAKAFPTLARDASGDASAASSDPW